MGEYEAKMIKNNEVFKIEFVGGPHDGLFGRTKQRVNEVDTPSERHPDCLGWVKNLYRRSNPDSEKFYYVETTNDIQGCIQCKQVRDKIAEREAEKAEREAFRELQKTIEVVHYIFEGDYDWSEAQIGKSSDGRLWIRYGSGCSCNSIEEENWTALTDRAQAISATRHIGTPIERANFIAKAQELLGENK